jgi:hypothetical protein
MQNFLHTQSVGQSRYVLLLAGAVGELLIGGTIFGWNALSVILKELGFFAEGCLAPTQQSNIPDNLTCASQENKLAIVWNAGAFAVNFGPALVGVALDYLGPRVVTASGAALASVGILMMGKPFYAIKPLHCPTKRSGIMLVCIQSLPSKSKLIWAIPTPAFLCHDVDMHKKCSNSLQLGIII